MAIHMIHRASVAAAAVALAATLLVSLAGVAKAGTPEPCKTTDDTTPFGLATRLLTGPAGGDLTLTLTTATPGCVVPNRFERIEVETGALEEPDSSRQRFEDVAAIAGVATVSLGRIARGQRIAVRVRFRSGDRGHKYDIRDSTTALLRPDLVATVSAPRQILNGRTFTVDVRVAERNGDVGATANLTLSAGATQVGTKLLDLPAGATVTKAFEFKPAGPGSVQLRAVIADASPRETSTANNEGQATVEVTEFELDQSQVLVPSLAGYGAHFNHRIYSVLGKDVGITPINVLELEKKVVALEPQFVRMFVNDADLTNADRKQSFIRTMLLAQSSGATINLTWQGGTLDVKTGSITRLAAVLNDLVLNKGVTNLRWLTLQNEPNGTRVTLKEYETRYRTLDPLISAIRGQVRYMGGDLVRSGGLANADQQGQQVWFDYMATHMGDILDAWSVHVFWDYWDTGKLQDRLNEVRAIWDDEPADGRKPLYVTEYGVRGLKTLNGVSQGDPGSWSDGTPITQTNINAFQHAWFDILAARDGYLGTVKWDSYFGKYDSSPQSYFMIGPPEAWQLYPIYHDVRLWTMTLKPGWKVVGLDGASGSKLLAGYAGPSGDMTVLGLDTSGAQLNAASSETVGYSIGGLPPLATFHVAVWNETGDGQTRVDGDVVADPAGVVTVSIPLHAVFSLTTLPVGAA